MPTVHSSHAQQPRVPGMDEAASEAVQLTELAANRREELRAELRLIQGRITDLQQQEAGLLRQIDAFDVILGDAGEGKRDAETDEHAQVSPIPVRSDPRRKSPHAIERANVVVRFLQGMYPEAMHFREIYVHLEQQGMGSNSADPANTLLAYYSDDERLERIMRGTYRAKKPS